MQRHRARFWLGNRIVRPAHPAKATGAQQNECMHRQGIELPQEILRELQPDANGYVGHGVP